MRISKGLRCLLPAGSAPASACCSSLMSLWLWRGTTLAGVEWSTAEEHACVLKSEKKMTSCRNMLKQRLPGPCQRS
jgi:hypothetical protein